MKLLVLAENYSTKEKVSLAYIHTRNLEYVKQGIELDVISFSSTTQYTLDGINIYSLKQFCEKKDVSDYDLVVSHAPNIRHHCKFINEHYDKIKKIVFFFHGHEVLYTKEAYPKPYDYVKNENRFKSVIKDIYDVFKMIYLTKFFNKTIEKAEFIFVSEWMYQQFKKNIKLDEAKYKEKSHIIYNGLGEVFSLNNYDRDCEKKYDFITIRNMLDGSKYCIDVVNNLAKKNPNMKFLVVGKGKFFEYNEAPSNLTYELKNLNHAEIIEYLNASRCALMPTRTDAQGVMMCEMAVFGIPVITSDIYVCKMVLGDVENVDFINNNNTDVNLKEKLVNLVNKKYSKSDKFSYNNTILKEIKVFDSLINK